MNHTLLPPLEEPPLLLYVAPPDRVDDEETLGAEAVVSELLYTLFERSCCTLLDIISGLDVAGAVDFDPLLNHPPPLLDVVDFDPLEKPELLVEDELDFVPLENPELLLLDGELDRDPLEKLLDDDDLDPLEKLDPAIASMKSAPITNKLKSAANTRDFLNITVSFPFDC